MSDLKEIFGLLPKFRNGRELTVSYDRTGYWFAGYPNRDGDYSIDLYATDRDIEGACLNLLSQTDKDTTHNADTKPDSALNKESSND